MVYDHYRLVWFIAAFYYRRFNITIERAFKSEIYHKAVDGFCFAEGI